MGKNSLATCDGKVAIPVSTGGRGTIGGLMRHSGATGNNVAQKSRSGAPGVIRTHDLCLRRQKSAQTNLEADEGSAGRTRFVSPTTSGCFQIEMPVLAWSASDAVTI